MDAATIKGVVDRLKLRGLMRAKPDPEDGRMRLISLTPAGRRLADRVIPAATEIPGARWHRSATPSRRCCWTCCAG